MTTHSRTSLNTPAPATVTPAGETDLPERIDPQLPLGDILRLVPEHRYLLEKLGFHVVSDAEKSLAEACQVKQLDSKTVARVLTALVRSPARDSAPVAVELMNLSELCDYLESVHHSLLKTELNRLDLAFRTVIKEAGGEGERFSLILERFHVFQQNLLQHLKEEAEVLFPLIRQLDNERIARTGIMDILKTPLEQMKREHSEADEELAELQALAFDDDWPSSLAPSLRILSNAFQKFETILHGEIYQENQVLFRRVSALVSGS